MITFENPDKPLFSLPHSFALFSRSLSCGTFGWECRKRAMVIAAALMCTMRAASDLIPRPSRYASKGDKHGPSSLWYWGSEGRERERERERAVSV